MPPPRNLPLPTKALQDAAFTSLQERMSKDLFAFDAEQRKENDALSLERIGGLQLPEDGGITGTTGYESMLGEQEPAETPQNPAESSTDYGETPQNPAKTRTTGLMSPTLDMPAMMQPQRRQAVYDPTQTVDIQGEPDYDPSQGTGTVFSGPAGVSPGSATGPVAAPTIAGKFPEEQARIYQQARASGLDDEGARVLVAVSETEGGARGAVGDDGRARGVYQFHDQGEFPSFAAWTRKNGIEGDPAALAVDPEVSTRYAAEGYLGQAIKRGRELGYSGAELATYVQRTGQRSVRPEDTGNNYTRLFGQGAPSAPVAATPTQRAAEGRAQSGETRLQGITPPQFGLGDADADAICGPVLAMAFATSNGRNPTIAEAKQMAATHGGWTSAQGMGGPEAMANTLRQMGIPATYKPGPLDIETIRRETQNGNPVGINTRGHYFVVEGVDADGRLDLGNSAKALKASGGRQWFRPEEIPGLGRGAPTGAIYKDSPSSPAPSVAVREARMPTVSGTIQEDPTARRERDALALTADLPSAGSPPASAGGPTPAEVSPLDEARTSTGGDDLMARNPLDVGVPVRDRWADEPQVPYDPDSGPRETGYTVPGPQPSSGPGSVGVAAGSETARPATAPSQATAEEEGGYQSQQRPSIQISQGGPPTPSAQWTPVETRPTPQPSPEPASSQFKPLYDVAGQIVGYVQDTAEGVKRAATGLYEAGKEPKNAIDTVASAGQKAYEAALAESDPKNPVNAVTASLPIQRGVQTAQAAINAFGEEIGSRTGAAAGLDETGQKVAGFAGSMILDPTNYIGAPSAAARTGRALVEAATPVVREGAEVAGRQIGRAGYALAEEGARQLMDLTPSPRIVPPGEARRIPGGVRMPADPTFVAAVEGTPGARLTEDGLEIDLQRFQKPKQAGQPVSRGGAHYEPDTGEPGPFGNRGYYDRRGERVGGPQRVAGPTVFQRPLVVSGGATPAESAMHTLRGPEAFRALDDEYWTAVDGLFDPTTYRPRLGVRPEQIAARIEPMLTRHGFGAADVDAVVNGWGAVPGKGSWDLRDKVLETIAAAEVRAAGHDGVVTTVPGIKRLGEILDVRESHYPTPEGGYTLRPEFQPPAADDGVQHLGSGFVPSRGVPTPDARQIEQRAIQEFGTTDDLHQTGFILNDGTGLNMTGRTQGTDLLGDIDHMQIGRATGVHESEAAERFMRDTGAMRIRVDPYALDAAVPIPVTPAQKRALIRAARDTQAANIDVVDPQLGELGESVGYRNFRLPQQRADLSNFIASLPEQAADDGVQQLGSGVVPSRRMYHGTAGAFAAPDPGKFDPNGLFGPGYYLTSDPRVASSYAEAGMSLASDAGKRQARLLADREELVPYIESYRNGPLREAFGAERADRELADVTKQIADIDRELAAVPSGPNVRAVDVPSGLRMLDMDGAAPPDLVKAARDAGLIREPSATVRMILEKEGKTPTPPEQWTAERLYKHIAREDVPGSKISRENLERANQWLVEHGYDGIQHTGGRRVPMLDDAGKPIEHDVTIIFPESLTKITNAFSGEPGGSGVVPRLSTGLRADAFNAAQGGVMGAASEDLQAQQEGREADPAERARRALIGAGLATAGGRVARRGPAAAQELGSGGPIRRSPPTIDDGPLPRGPKALPGPAGRTADDLIVAAHGAVGVPERASVLEPERLERWRRNFVRAWTDNRVDLAEAQVEARRLLGRPLTGDEMMLELSRVNPTGAAKTSIDENLRPILTGLDSSKPVVTVTSSDGKTAAMTETQVLARMRELTNNRDVAQVLGNPDRKFPGGLTGAESEEAARALLEKLPRETQVKIGQANNALTDVIDTYRERLVDAGVWSRELADDLKAKYPNWVPTKILDYMRDEGQPGAAGIKSIGLSNRHLHQYLFEGTSKMREDGIASTIRYIQQAEEDIAKNRTFNAFVRLRDQIPEWQGLIREVKSDTPVEALRGEKPVTGWVDGEKKRYIVPAPLSAAIQMEQTARMPVIGAMTAGFRELITRSPAFVAGQIPLDFFSTLIRESAREGGPQYAPKVAAAIVGGYREAFRGLMDGTFKGDTAAYLREGGAMAGYYQRSAQSASKALDETSRKSMFEFRNADDVKKTLKWLATLEPVTAVGQRVELAPRTASFRLGRERAIQRGMAEGAESTALVPTNEAGAKMQLPERTTKGVDERRANLEAMTGARDVSLDFQRGGTFSRTLNQMIPFFNVGVQSSATPWRSFREAPKGYAATVVGAIGAPLLAAEAWNRSDPQRAQDYDDVPDYVKDRGIVIMTGSSWTDKNGERRPQYALIPTRELSPFVILGRELSARAMDAVGISPREQPRAWGEMLEGAVGAASPVQANNPGDLFSSANPIGLNTGAQLAFDQDTFRDRKIATDRGDREAGVVARGAAAVARSAGGLPFVGESLKDTRPSQAEFALRDTTGNLGAAVLAGADLVASMTGTLPEGAEPKSLESTPITASVTKRFVGDATGSRLERAQADENRIPDIVKEALDDAGMAGAQVTPVSSEYKGARLTREEQQMWQEATNAAIVREFAQIRRDTNWRTPATRPRAVQEAVMRAKDVAAERVLRGLNAREIERRKKAS